LKEKINFFILKPGVTETGDLIVVLQVIAEHELFKRDKNDLYMSHKVNITEALCGFKLEIKHLDGRILVINQPAGEILGRNYFF